MAWESTLCCDGCSAVVGAGTREDCLGALIGEGGRAFIIGDKRGTWREIDLDDGLLHATKRHLCGSCASTTEFFDGTPVPATEETG